MHGQCDARPTVPFMALLPLHSTLEPNYTVWWVREQLVHGIIDSAVGKTDQWPLDHESYISSPGYQARHQRQNVSDTSETLLLTMCYINLPHIYLLTQVFCTAQIKSVCQTQGISYTQQSTATGKNALRSFPTERQPKTDTFSLATQTKQNRNKRLTSSCVLRARRWLHHSFLSIIFMLFWFSCITASNSPRSFWPCTRIKCTVEHSEPLNFTSSLPLTVLGST